MSNPTNLFLAGLALAAGTVAVAGDVDRLPTTEAGYYRAIKPVEAEEKWKKVPWMTRLDEAVKTAAKEKRPVCIWVVDNEPLDRC